MLLVCSLLTEAAREWIAAFWTGVALPFHSYATPTHQLWEVFNLLVTLVNSFTGSSRGDRQQPLTCCASRVWKRTDWTISLLSMAFYVELSAELHQITIVSLFTIESPGCPVILGLP